MFVSSIYINNEKENNKSSNGDIDFFNDVFEKVADAFF